jgi:hypothetical protein
MVEATKRFVPDTGSEAEWNAAYQRLETYLLALQITNKVQQSQIILRWLESAASVHLRQPDQSLTTLAMAEAHAAMESWFGKIIPNSEQGAVAGLVSVLASDAPEKYLAEFPLEAISTELSEAMPGDQLRAGPELQISSMVPTPIELNPLPDRIRLDDLRSKLVDIWRSLLWPSE